MKTKLSKSLSMSVSLAGVCVLLASCNGGEATESCTDRFEPNDTTETASKALETDTAVTAKICSGADVDYYEITLAHADAISVEMIPPSTRDYGLELYDLNKTLVASAVSGIAGQTEAIDYSASASTYYIKVVGTAAAFDTTATYSLTAVWPPAVSNGSTGATGFPLTLDVSKDGAGTGKITSAPARIDCLPTCSATFPDGVATLTATPAANGATFEGWSGACSGSGLCTVARQAGMDANQSVKATFGQVYTGSSLSGSSTITRPMTYGTCTWNSTWTCSASMLVVGWETGSLTGNMTVICDRSEPAGTASDPAWQTCLAGGGHYEDTQPITGTPSNITWTANPFDGSSFLNASFTGAMSGNVGTLGGDSVSGTLTISAYGSSSGGGTVAIDISR
jgi:hypothetical protein